MPAATASGSDAKPNGSAQSRQHNQGNQDRKYTPEQKAEVIRVRRCQPTAFYEILNLESVKTTVTDTEIKKAYRKISLLTHPDKNGHEHADEVFKMVSRAFGVLGDPDKRSKYDKFGGDPDSRFGGGAPPQSPFSGGGGFSGRQRQASGQGGGGMWENEMSPEEMFQRFFGGGGFGGGMGGMFGAEPQFVFNMGGGPGIRVQQFGGNRPRRRPRDPNAPPEPPASLSQTLMGFLPLAFLLLLPILSSLFGGDTASETLPRMRFDSPVPPHTLHRQTPRYKVDYYVRPTDIESYSTHQLKRMDNNVEVKYVQGLSLECQAEANAKQNMLNQAEGWFFTDVELVNRANNLPLRSCAKLDALGVLRY